MILLCWWFGAVCILSTRFTTSA